MEKLFLEFVNPVMKYVYHVVININILANHVFKIITFKIIPVLKNVIAIIIFKKTPKCV